jgi:hypothetical protein
MPTTTRSRTTTHSSSSVLERDPGLDGLELGIDPGLTGGDRSERERAEIAHATHGVEIGGGSPVPGP